MWVLYDFQCVVGRLFDIPVVNCSVYDGATPLAKSAWVALLAKGVQRIVVACSLWPNYLQVLTVYMANRKVHVKLIKSSRALGQVIAGLMFSCRT